MNQINRIDCFDADALDADVAVVSAAATSWAHTTTAERIAILDEIRDRTAAVADGWVGIAARRKLLPAGSPLAGEEWLSGPYALISACNGLIETLSNLDGKRFLRRLRKRRTATGQLAVRVLPHTLWDRLLLSGVSAEIWMQPGVTSDNLASHTASAYDAPAAGRTGRVGLVLGAGNIAAIAPLDVLHMMFVEHRAVILKMNPVNDYLTEYLSNALRPLIVRDALRIVRGGADVGAYLCAHPSISAIHITGAAASHDAIVWGAGAEGVANRAAGTPKLDKTITSELGAVCPTIVVPGPWSRADLAFQAEHIATQKLHNSGFNCVACQMLVISAPWTQKEALLDRLRRVMASLQGRPAYYPGAAARLSAFSDEAERIERVDFGTDGVCLLAPAQATTHGRMTQTEVFGPALSVHEIGEDDPAAFLAAAIDYANTQLHGTLGANILIHPATLRQIGQRRFEELLGGLRYGAIAINAWSGLAFLNTACSWGAFPGHTLRDVGSGIGVVHNTWLFDRPERSVVRAPWRPFPRNLLSGELSLLPKPPWFVSHRTQHHMGRLLTRFQHRPSLLKLPRIFLHALRG